jgi:hypothetical protein
VPGQVVLSMTGYIDNLLEKYKVKTKAKTPATDMLFVSDPLCPKLSKPKQEMFHSCVMELYYLAKRAVTAVSYCATKVLFPDRFFSDDDHKSYHLFEAGNNREGWFTNKDLVEQFNELTPLIRSLHPECDIVIAFDNSMTHHAKVPDGLDVSKLKLSDGMASSTKVDMKPG